MIKSWHYKSRIHRYAIVLLLLVSLVQPVDLKSSYVNAASYKTGFSYNLTYPESEIKVTDVLSGRYVTYMLNDKGLISSIKDQENHTCALTYDDNNCLIQITDVNGKATKYTYDNDGRILTLQPYSAITLVKQSTETTK